MKTEVRELSRRVNLLSVQKNNAIAQLNLDTNLVATVIAMGNRSWTDYYLDPSDMDGGWWLQLQQ